MEHKRKRPQNISYDYQHNRNFVTSMNFYQPKKLKNKKFRIRNQMLNALTIKVPKS